MVMEIDCRCMCYRCEDREKRTYQLAVQCGNCGVDGTATLRVGDRPPTMKICPHCGVSDLYFKPLFALSIHATNPGAKP
jgi:hypothetical protein